MKTLVCVLIAGGLFATGALAVDNTNTVAAPRLPFRPVQKRPSGARQGSVSTQKANVATPQLPFRHYQKQVIAPPSNKPVSTEAAGQ
jgi:hypothetical protein